jgi:hypothetical protein
MNLSFAGGPCRATKTIKEEIDASEQRMAYAYGSEKK